MSILLSVERKSTHPVAQAVVRYAEKQDSVPMEITDMRELAGHGVEAIVNGRQVLVGNIRLLAERDIPVPKDYPIVFLPWWFVRSMGNMRGIFSFRIP